MQLAPGMTLKLDVRATDTRTNASQDRSFTRFPVRFGRSSLNDFALDFSFVSQFHLVVARDGDQLLLRDLGGKNGTIAGGQKLAAHQPLDLATVGNTFDIGPLRFQVAASIVPKQASSEATSVMLAIDADAKPNATEVWQAITPGARPSGRDPRDVAMMGLRHFARAYVPDAGPLDTAESVQRFLGKIKESLDLLFGAFVPLRDGAKQFQTQLEIHRSAHQEAARPSDVVETAKHPLEIASCALDWRDPSNDVQATMQSAFADFVIHQLAMFDGVMSGVRALLKELSPQEIEALLAKKGSGMAFGPFKSGALWKLYTARHKDFSEEESQAFSVIFGSEFVKAFRAFTAERATDKPPGS
jgi:predicted component of type VI protein secretion system